MYDVRPWWTAFYFMMTGLAIWFLFWVGMWSTSLIIRLCKSSLFGKFGNR